MQDSTIQNLIATLLAGGPAGVIALLMLVIAGLLWDRRRVFIDNAKKDQKLDVMIENYYKSSISVGDALSSIKIVLAEISAKLIR
jgi:hypothetical protein